MARRGIGDYSNTIPVVSVKQHLLVGVLMTVLLLVYWLLIFLLPWQLLLQDAESATQLMATLSAWCIGGVLHFIMLIVIWSGLKKYRSNLDPDSIEDMGRPRF